MCGGILLLYKKKKTHPQINGNVNSMSQDKRVVVAPFVSCVHTRVHVQRERERVLCAIAQVHRVSVLYYFALFFFSIQFFLFVMDLK